ncbi:MAG TPA: molybdopterin-dependent oxidoreductase, partial [Candidatus Methylomirabilis sp.]|nr:molybdopterin-dependent oxidoreductase [Candidatus Methylomirabilis sp.]
MRITRRGFFGWAGAVAATAAGCQRIRALGDIQAATYEAEVPPQGIEGWVASVCQQCPGGCGILVRTITGTEDGIKRAVKIEGNPHHPISRGSICPKGVAGLQALYDPDRLRGPLKRIGPRGSGRWEPIGWDEALANTAERLRDLRTRGEAHSLVAIAGNVRGLMPALLERFLGVYGSPNYVTTAHGCETSRQLMRLTQGIDEPIAYNLERTNYVLIFGAGLLEAGNSPVRQARAFANLRQGTPGRRARIVDVDPRLSVSAAKADEWIPIRPGTDGALALGIAHVIVSEGLYDKAFVEEWTFGFEDWRDAAGPTRLGFRSLVLADYRPESVAAITGVPIATITRVAREFATARPALALGGSGASLHTNGLYNRLAIQALNALVGSVEAPGGTTAQRRPPMAPMPPVRHDAVAARGLTMPRLDHAGTDRAALATSAVHLVPESLRTGKPYPVGALLLYYANPAYSSPGFAHAPDLFDKIPFIVSFSPFLDETTRHADLVLPDHTYLERWQDDPVEAVWGPPVLGVRQPAIEPRHQTRHAGDVIIQLARALGGAVADAFPWKDFPDLLRATFQGVAETRQGLIMTTPFEEARQRRLAEAGFWLPSYRTFDEFWSQIAERGGWWDPADLPLGTGEAFRTPSKKYEFFCLGLGLGLERPGRRASSRRGADAATVREAALTALGVAARGDKVFLPHYEPPRFAGDPQEFPLHLVTYKPMALMGSRTANQPWLAEIPAGGPTRAWEAWVEINPETAHKLGIHDR